MNRGDALDDVFAVGRAVAADLLEWLQPLRFVEAIDQHEREAAYRLRYRAVVAGGMGAADDYPDGCEYDGHDDDAVHITGVDGDTVIATCRLVFARDGRPLPIEAGFEVTLPRSSGVVEWGRVAVDRSRHGEGHRLVMGLAARGWLAMAERGATTAVGATPERLVTFFRTLGFPLCVLGAPRLYWGEERYPVLCEGAAAVQALEFLWGGVHARRVRSRP